MGGAIRPDALTRITERDFSRAFRPAGRSARRMGENPDLHEYYEKRSKDELIPKRMLGKIQRSEDTNGRNAACLAERSATAGDQGLGRGTPRQQSALGAASGKTGRRVRSQHLRLAGENRFQRHAGYGPQAGELRSAGRCHPRHRNRAAIAGIERDTIYIADAKADVPLEAKSALEAMRFERAANPFVSIHPRREKPSAATRSSNLSRGSSSLRSRVTLTTTVIRAPPVELPRACPVQGQTRKRSSGRVARVTRAMGRGTVDEWRARRFSL